MQSKVYFGSSLTIAISIAISPVISHISSDDTVKLNMSQSVES